MSNDVREWMQDVSGPGWTWFVKRLSGNDTLANGSHQAGPYVPKPIALRLFPSLKRSDYNPRVDFPALIASHGGKADPNIIWYNNKLHRQAGNPLHKKWSRNECRITNWGGAESPVLDPDATGAICVFAFRQQDPAKDVQGCVVWLCSTLEEEDAVEDQVGPVEPGEGFEYDASTTIPPLTEPQDTPCTLKPEDIPAEWKITFPDGLTIVNMTVDRLPSVKKLSPDQRLVRRRDCEFELFRSVEQAAVLPRIKEGFTQVEHFIKYANAVTNRRKQRSGKSLELQAKRIFDEESLPHAHNEMSEGGKRPDFLFPSIDAYRSGTFPPEKLRMLAAKTTCKDRWRQIIPEADRVVPHKHLLTLQLGISVTQFKQMQEAGVLLVVPKSLHKSYNEAIRPQLISLETFIGETKAKCF